MSVEVNNESGVPVDERRIAVLARSRSWRTASGSGRPANFLTINIVACRSRARLGAAWAARSTATVVIDEQPIEPTDEYVTVPYQATDAFRTVVFTNPFGAPVLGGPIDVAGPDGYIGPAEQSGRPADLDTVRGLGRRRRCGLDGCTHVAAPMTCVRGGRVNHSPDHRRGFELSSVVLDEG